MNKIRSIIIDDEAATGTVLSGMLSEHCPSVEVLAYGSSVGEGFELIHKLHPDLVFLDVQMENETGFDLLRMFSELDFHVIFVTAFDKYALQAFEFNAVDYILKPVDYQRLVTAVEKVSRNIRFGDNSNVVHFVRSLDEQSQLLKSIPFHLKNRVVMVGLTAICYIQADRNYCNVITSDGRCLVSSKSLSDYEILLHPYVQFLRINKSTIINTHFIESYTKGFECIIKLRGSESEFEVSRRKKTEVLNNLREMC